MLPDLWLACDPGEVHVGMSAWSGTECLWAREFRPDEAADYVMGQAQDNGLSLLVYERFLLYPGAEQGRGQMGSEMETSQLIGVLKFICRHTGVEVQSHQASAHKGVYKSAAYKPPNKPLRGWKSYGHGTHAKDAECLGIYHVICHQSGKKGRGY